MDIRDLQSRFNQSREYTTDDVNALMDFAKKAYIHNEISITDYRRLVLELEKKGAVLPAYENSLIENSK